MVDGLDVVSSVSCVTDVGDVLAVNLEELVDNPGTTFGAQFSVLHWIFCLLDRVCFLLFCRSWR